VEIHGRDGQFTDDDAVHTHCVLDNWGYRRTLRIGNTYCPFTATMAKLTRLNVSMYVHCLSDNLFVVSKPNFWIPRFVEMSKS